MNILEVSNFFKPFWETGGVTKVNYELSKNLVKKGHNVVVYTTNGYRKILDVIPNKRINIDGIDVYYFNNYLKRFFQKGGLLAPLYAPIVLKKEINKFDIIHIHEHRTLLAVFVYYYAKKYKVPYVLQSHGSVLPFYKKNKIKCMFDYIVGNSILNGASKLIALNEIEMQQYIQMGVHKSKIEMIPNGINIEEFKCLPDRKSFKEKYSIKKEDKIILYLGRIDKIKGIDLLIEAFSKLAVELTNVQLVIAGPNNYYSSEIKHNISNLGINRSILFTGPLYGKDKLEAYVSADVYVLPSRYDIFGITILEACACGTPVVVTNGCGLAGFVDGRVGYVVEYDSIQLQNSIRKLLVNDNLRMEFANRCKHEIEDFYWSQIITKFESLYKECLGEQHEKI